MKQSQTTSTVLMVQPVQFGYNQQAAQSNSFMHAPTQSPNQVQQLALQEFNTLVEALQQAGVTVHVIPDTTEPATPDSIFPNNWFSTHRTSGQSALVLYPMESVSRRLERRDDVQHFLQSTFQYQECISLTHYEDNSIYLEGTGSMVLDRANNIAYVALSSRSQLQPLQEFCTRLGFTAITFHSQHPSGVEVYHTNVIMSIGKNIAVVCFEVIPRHEQDAIRQSLQSTGHTILELTIEQLNNFAGNMLNLASPTGENIWVMSSSAWSSLTPAQQQTLSNDGAIVQVPIPTIEHIGGGSVRCMIAEVF